MASVFHREIELGIAIQLIGNQEEEKEEIEEF